MSDENKQHQGEPVAWVHPAYLKPGAIGFEASVTRLALAQVPLYTHADPGEVERLREQLAEAQGRIRTLEAVNEVGVWADTAIDKENAALRAQLAERGTLLREAHEELVCRDSPVAQRIIAALSASAPVAWRIPVSGSWFYDTKREACEREYADYRSAFTAEELAEEDMHAPEPLYTHADPGEVERLREENDAIRLQAGGMQMELDELRAQLAERDALLRRALPDLAKQRFLTDAMAELYAYVAAVCCSGKSSAPVGDGVHDDTEAVRARLAANYFESKP